MSAVLQSAPVTAAERAFDFYAIEYMTAGRFYAWLESGNTERQPCAFWDDISNNELRDLLLKKPLNHEQYIATLATLKRRFVQEHEGQITELMNSEDHAPDNGWRARQDACGVTA